MSKSMTFRMPDKLAAQFEAWRTDSGLAVTEALLVCVERSITSGAFVADDMDAPAPAPISKAKGKPPAKANLKTIKGAVMRASALQGAPAVDHPAGKPVQAPRRLSLLYFDAITNEPVYG